VTVAFSSFEHHADALRRTTPRERALATLEGVQQSIAEELAQIEAAMADLTTPPGPGGQSAAALLNRPGKRLRPTAVVLSSQLGRDGGSTAVELAVGVELVHAATLLHDDVIDRADRRRGGVTAHRLYGERAATLGGDALLMAGLSRVQAVAAGECFDLLLDTIRRMVRAETLQLESRDLTVPSRNRYLQIASGKTSALFEWCLAAGGSAGGLDPLRISQLQRVGRHLGLAFQVLDDLLDVVGEAEEMGKDPLKDLAEGKITYPSLVALAQSPDLRHRLERRRRDDLETASRLLLQETRRPEVITSCRSFVEERVRTAARLLGRFRGGAGREGLEGLLSVVATLARG
jgi:geranylgeranyl pyrophosphate synthase